MTLTVLLHRMGYDRLTVHGFRSTFRDWVADSGGPADAAERALAHVIGNKVRGAYERTDLLDLRRKLMADWASFLTRPAGVVVPAAASGGCGMTDDPKRQPDPDRTYDWRASAGILIDPDGTVIFDGEAEAMGAPPFRTLDEIKAAQAEAQVLLDRNPQTA